MAYNQQPTAGYYQPQGANPYAPGYNAGPQQYPPQQPGFQQAPGNPHYAEGGVAKSELGFTDQSIRAAFVRKVFTTVSLMLAVVAIMTAIPFIHTPTMKFVQHNIAIYYMGYFTFLAVYLALMCCESVRRSFPANIICTAILTLSIGFMTMMITSFYQIEVVLMVLVITAVCCGGIALFATQTKYDMTNCMGFMCIASLLLMVFGFVAVISVAAFHVRFIYTIYAGLATLLFMGYLAIDIQMIMGGRKHEISPEEHIFASVQLFIDIVYIFWMLLMLFGNNN